MNMLKLLMIAVSVSVALVGYAADNKSTFRDAQGRNMGSATTDLYGKTTYRDAQGRIQGTKK